MEPNKTILKNEEKDGRKKPRKTFEQKCQLCGTVMLVKSKNKKYCGLKKYTKQCETCGKDFTQPCSGRLVKFCSKSCQSKNPEIIIKANKKRKDLGYLQQNAENSSKKIKEKYGVDNISQLEWVKEKKNKNPNIPKFGSENFKKIIKEKYDVDNISQLEWVKEKKKTTCMKNYGVENPSQSKEIIDKITSTIFEKYGVKSYLTLPEVQQKAAENNKYRISKINQTFKEKLLKETGIIFDFEYRTKNSFLADLGYKNLIIDINPSISHSSTASYPHLTGICRTKDCNKKKHEPRKQDYHQKRAIEAETNQTELLQLFDWFDEDIFIDIIKSKLGLLSHKIFAKNTILKEISQNEANKFLQENHLLGSSNGQTVCIGLFEKIVKEYKNSEEKITKKIEEGELLHVQTFGKSRFNKNVEWEAIRSCSKKDHVIVGGFTKCDKFFMKKYNPESIISYVDMATSTGQTELSFNNWEFSHLTKPSATWVKILSTENNKKASTFISDSSIRRLSADRLFGFEPGTVFDRFDNTGREITNKEIMLSQGYIQVFDTGRKVFIWRKNN